MSQTARELGVTPKSLYSWVNAYSGDNGKTRTSKEPASEEIKRLKKELSKVTIERDILRSAVLVKKATAYLCHLGTLPKTLYKVRLDYRASPSFFNLLYVLFSARISQLILPVAQPIKD